MECFEILGIDQTKDTKVIRKAYAKLLPKYSPETDPEGFKNLRAAYEEALSTAKEEVTETTELTPSELFMKEFEENYKDFNKRMSIEVWERLLDKDICMKIDTSKEISTTILAFLMDNYYLPNKIWVLFDKHFSWTTKKEKLCEVFPRNYIDFLMYKIKEKDTFRYEALLESDITDADEFISLHDTANNALDNNDLFVTLNSINAAEKLLTGHPDILVLKGRYLSQTGKPIIALEIYNEIISKNDKDYNAYFYRGELLILLGKLEEAYSDLKTVVDLKTDSVAAMFSLGKCCIYLGKYEEAIDYLKQLNEKIEFNQEIIRLLQSAYNFQIVELKKELTKGEDINIKFKLAEAYTYTKNEEAATEILMEINEKGELTNEMYLLLIQALLAASKLEMAFSEVCKAVEKYPSDPALVSYKANILDDFGREQEAIEYYDLAITLDPEAYINYNNKAYSLNKLGRYEEALSCCEKSLSIFSNASYTLKNKAKALLGLSFYEDCITTCNEALSLFPYLGEAYFIKMKALNDIDMYDEAIKVFNTALEHGVVDLQIRLEKANSLRLSYNFHEAIDNCEMVLQEDEDLAQAYQCMGLCKYNLDEYAQAINCFDKAISLDASLGVSYYNKILCFKEQGNIELALKELDIALELDLVFKDILYKLKGDLLAKEEKFEQALEAYKNALELSKNNAFYHYLVGSTLTDVEKFEESIEYFDKAIEIDDNNAAAHIDKSYALFNLNEFDASIEECDKAIVLEPESYVAYQNKAWANFSLARFEDAEKVCLEGLAINSNNKNLLNLKLKILMKKGSNKEALVVTDRILELDPDSENILALRKELMDKVMKGEGNKKGFLGTLFGKN